MLSTRIKAIAAGVGGFCTALAATTATSRLAEIYNVIMSIAAGIGTYETTYWAPKNKAQSELDR